MTWRLVRLLLVAIAAWVLFTVLEPHGLGWAVLPLAIAATLLVAGLRYLRLRWARRRGQDEQGWADALLDPDARPRAIAQVRAARARLGPPTPRTRSRHARLSVLLAELLDAEGRADEARALLDGVDMDVLGRMDQAAVRHGRAMLRLRAGQPEDCLRVLETRQRSCGDDDLDMRLSLLEASARLEMGETQEAIQTAKRIRDRAGGDESLLMEARVVRAAALDAAGDRSGALDAVRSLGPSMVAVLCALGQPRVRSLAEEVRGADEEDHAQGRCPSCG